MLREEIKENLNKSKVLDIEYKEPLILLDGKKKTYFEGVGISKYIIKYYDKRGWTVGKENFSEEKAQELINNFPVKKIRWF